METTMSLALAPTSPCESCFGLKAQKLRYGNSKLRARFLAPRAVETLEQPRYGFRRQPILRDVGLEKEFLGRNLKTEDVRRDKTWLEPEKTTESEFEFVVLSPEATTLADALRKHTDKENAWNILDGLNEESRDTFKVVLEYFLEHKDWPRIMMMCEWLMKSKTFEPDIDCYNFFFNALGKTGKIMKADKLFQDMGAIPNEETFAILLDGFRREHLSEKAEGIFEKMQKGCYPAGPLVCNTYLRFLLETKDYKKAEKFFIRWKTYDIDAYNMMIVMYGKARQPYKSAILYQYMRRSLCTPTIVTLNAVIYAFARQGLVKEALKYFDKMSFFNYKPDRVTYKSLMEAYCQDENPEGAAEMFSAMQNSGISPDAVAYKILINAYANVGRYEDAEKTFQAMKDADHSPDLNAKALLMKAYAVAEKADEAKKLLTGFEKEKKIKPNSALYNTLLNAYRVTKRFDDMGGLIEKMKKKRRTSPDIGTYNVLIQKEADAADIFKAEEIFESLPGLGLVPDEATWTALLSAYAKRQNIKMCMRIVKKMQAAGFRPDSNAKRVLLSACRSEDQLQETRRLIDTLQGNRKGR